MTNVKELVDNIDPSFGIFSDVTPGVLVNSADVERSKQVLDRIRQVFLSEQLELVEELEDLNANLIADDHDDFEGGSRLKRKQKLKTTKKRNKKHRKQNKSKRHKGYLRR
jgi:BioD-like phosphotransacetylase family protein